MSPSHFPRIGLGLLKSHSASPSPRTRDIQSQDDEADWYIPYNGPYEPPRDTSRRDKEPLRDSWGDPVVDGNDHEMPILDDEELHNRYGPVSPVSLSGDWSPPDERKGRPRARTQSEVSGRTVSSGTVDPSRLSLATTARRNTVTSASHHPPVPSYINLDTAGGVGESPVPKQRNYRDTPSSSSRRKSLVSLFTFNSASKRQTPSPQVERKRQPGSPGPPKSLEIPTVPSDPVAAEQVLRASAAGGELDYYHSYYSTLQSPNNNQKIFHQSHHASDKLPPSSPQGLPIATESEPSSATHPYAYVLSTPMAQAETVQSASPPKTHFDRSPIRHIYLEKNPSRIVNSHLIPQATRHSLVHSLQNSTSTPNLRNASQIKPTLPKGKDRWLSAETWCDALLFPRPRFKVKRDKGSKSSRDSSFSGSGRIVSPPGSPVFGYSHDGNAPQNSIASRVLAHSRSMLELREPGPSGQPRADMPRVPEAPEQVVQSSSSALRPPRPKSWALDDLALPSPIPSLSRVLEEGQILEHQRKKWQTQAINSFQNQRVRSLSRARSKSLSNKKRKEDSTLDYLAARGLLGDQTVIPINVIKPRRRADSQTESRGTTLGQTSSHRHTSSLTKSITTRSSKTHSHNHSRTESLGKSAVKVVKSTANALCSYEGVSPAEEKVSGLEGALKRSSTKVIKLADPAQLHIESPISSGHGHSVSPTPSGVSGSMIGIAVTTTPAMTDETMESIRMPSHPYAQGGYLVRNPAPAEMQSNAHVQTGGLIALPASWHPYANVGSSSRDSYRSEFKVLPRARTDSNVPAPQKMWAQWTSGIVQEVLPNEIQYSPYLPNKNSAVGDESPLHEQARKSIYDTAGVGEALAFAAMEPYSRDSGIGTSEEHTSIHVENDAGSSSLNSSNRHRKPVQYDVTRPLHLQKNYLMPTSPLQADIASAVTHPGLSREESSDSGGNKSSESSPPISPPPLGNVDDLDNFHDLFFRPSIYRNVSHDGVPWDVTSSNQRGSGVTSIARQLSEELNGSRASLKHPISLRSQSSLSALRQSLYEARTPPVDANMRFVFSDLPETASLNLSGERRHMQANILTFQSSIQIPEDIESSGASSPMASPVENELDDFRVGNVEPVTTPPAVNGENRVSFAGQMAFVTNEGEPQSQLDHHNEDDAPLPHTAYLTTAHSSLQPPSSVPTRSSFMTTSDGSRMSGLSDFPEPPPQRMTPAHMSLLSSYFDDTVTEKEIADVQAYGHVKATSRSRSGSILTSRPEALGVRPPEVSARSEQQPAKS
ncbi:hypothetical protein D9757_001873 [Collybiopsis confluens]|uniref:Uncharacterized protein n=1 Tax=Collybiopsis confluens TaxID=2823264 RepID=A0A8H5HXI3_9AGAR|nr:hypothetical protein D9757_001873 [Collybiopsis confluens]